METKQLKIFLTAKKNLESLDLYENQCPIDRKQLSRILQTLLAIVLQFLYVFYDANTNREYIDSILMITLGVLLYIAYWSTISNKIIIYDLVNSVEKIINES